MKTSEQGMKIIKEFEGLRFSAYICPAGLKTIGYGHVMANNDNRATIDMKEAEALFEEDINKTEHAVMRNIGSKLTQGQFDALVSFTFNVGPAALQRSTLRQKINRNEYEEAGKEFIRWVYAGGFIIQGLVKRRRIETEMFLS